MSAEATQRRVLIVIENLPAPFDRRVWQEATTLRQAGYQVTIVCPRMKGYTAGFEEIDGVHIHRHPMPPEAKSALGYPLEYLSALFWETVYAWRVFFTRGFDVLHACNPPDTIFLVALPFKLLGCRFLFDHHDLCPELYEAKFARRGWIHRALVFLERATFRAADVSIATNESYRKVAIERGGMDPEQVFIVRSGPSLERMRIVPPVPAYRKGRRYLVGYVGVMGRQEGLDYLLEAVRYIVYQLGRTDIHFALIGGGPDIERIQERSVELGIAEYVTFTGRVPDDELLAVLNTADVCVNPDEYNEMNDKSTMNKIMEYMALGKPIVQFDLTEGRFSAGEASLYAKRNDSVDLGDKILALLADEERCKRMGEIGRERVVHELSWDHEAPKLLRAYAALWKSS